MVESYSAVADFGQVARPDALSICAGDLKKRHAVDRFGAFLIPLPNPFVLIAATRPQMPVSCQVAPRAASDWAIPVDRRQVHTTHEVRLPYRGTGAYLLQAHCRHCRPLLCNRRRSWRRIGPTRYRIDRRQTRYPRSSSSRAPSRGSGWPQRARLCWKWIDLDQR